MKKTLVFICLLINALCYSQKTLETPYEHKMDSIAIHNLEFTYNTVNNGITDIFDLRRVKVTFATRVNTDDFSNFNINADNLDDVFSDATTDDFLSIFKYDIRGKFYITRDIRFITRTVVMGTKYKTNQYSAGFYIKF